MRQHTSDADLISASKAQFSNLRVRREVIKLLASAQTRVVSGYFNKAERLQVRVFLDDGACSGKR